MTEERLNEDLPSLVSPVQITLTSDGRGQYPDAYTLTWPGVARVAAWLSEHASDDVEDCEACEACTPEYCPVHLGEARGIEAVARKLRAIGADPELLALIPDPKPTKQEPEA